MLCKDRPIEARLYGLHGCEHCITLSDAAASHVVRTTITIFVWENGKKISTMSCAPSGQDVLFIKTTTTFSVKLLEYHSALQFPGAVSATAMAWAQDDVLWEDDNEHVIWRKEFSAAHVLYLLCLQESDKMSSVPLRQRRSWFGAINSERPLVDGWLKRARIGGMHTT